MMVLCQNLSKDRIVGLILRKNWIIEVRVRLILRN